MKKNLCTLLFFSLSCVLYASQSFSLDSCRSMALTNNKTIQIGKEQINAASYHRKAAFTKYLPELSATGSYFRNQKNIALAGEDLHLPNFVKQADNSWKYDPNNYTLIPKSELEFDMQNVFAGALTLTQPIYFGGKIRAYNKITQYVEELAKTKQSTEIEEVIVKTDETYWQIVSLTNKLKLAKEYVSLLHKLESDVDKMVKEGLATKADGLTIKVKVNEGEISLTKVENGLSLSKMLLCQLCGLDLITPISLADENIENITVDFQTLPTLDIHAAFNNREELKSLELAQKIFDQKVKLARSEHLPTLAFTANYLVTNPSFFNGYEKKLDGMWNVGVLLQVPIFHFGEGGYKVKAAKAEARIASLYLSETKEKIELQVNQSVYKVNEADRKLAMTLKNREKAEENLRYANVGFEEGIITSNNVLEAHTAWLSAQNEMIDAQIDIKLCEMYLKKAMGTVHY